MENENFSSALTYHCIFFFIICSCVSLKMQVQHLIKYFSYQNLKTMRTPLSGANNRLALNKTFDLYISIPIENINNPLIK